LLVRRGAEAASARRRVGASARRRVAKDSWCREPADIGNIRSAVREYPMRRAGWALMPSWLRRLRMVIYDDYLDALQYGSILRRKA
jgi:hypothetical protein